MVRVRPPDGGSVAPLFLDELGSSCIGVRIQTFYLVIFSVILCWCYSGSGSTDRWWDGGGPFSRDFSWFPRAVS